MKKKCESVEKIKKRRNNNEEENEVRSRASNRLPLILNEEKAK